MRHIFLCLLMMGFSTSALANTTLFNSWIGNLARNSNNFSCSTAKPASLTISTDGQYLYVDLSGGCSAEPFTMLFMINGKDLYLGNQRIGSLSNEEISIERQPGQFGGPTFKLQIRLSDSVVNYFESVEGSSHDYTLLGRFTSSK